eukprot:8134618-Pyramimonas_sp.AAC.1
MPPLTTLATCKGTCKVNMDHCTTGSHDPQGVLIRKPTGIVANHRFYLHLLNEKDVLAIINMRRHVTTNCPWLHIILQGYSLCSSTQLRTHTVYSKLTVAPFHGRPYFSTVLVASARGHDLDDPTIYRQPDGSITRPPSGGLWMSCVRG